MLETVPATHDCPPCCTRPRASETIVRTILEPQVSLASAYAVYKKVKEKAGTITPEAVRSLRGEELHGCHFSRQKIVDVRELANAILSKSIHLKTFEKKEEDGGEENGKP